MSAEHGVEGCALANTLAAPSSLRHTHPHRHGEAPQCEGLRSQTAHVSVIITACLP
jgi:hypothetical protein